MVGESSAVVTGVKDSSARAFRIGLADLCDVGADIGLPSAPGFRRGFFHRGEQFCTDAALKFGLGGECVHWLLAVRPMPLIALKESDPHSKRIVFDTVEWHFRLEQLAEMRRRTPTSARHDNAQGIVAAFRET
jgi:hypothetical protein